ncbi:hypothetical protein CASFOL_021978 [Castilleja foliolosa]|uniref:F-box domain-containing protein n=1 Tax=Castilleja foliolosa TaxID=1961234 RepID=A0ABD3D0V0_9LAMI
MNTRSVKRRRGDDNGSDITIDRLSQLPQPILHNILSLISQRDAIRTCVLSKSWRYLWHGRFNVEFREVDHRCTRKNEFWSFIYKTLQRYIDQNLSLHKFLVDTSSVVDYTLLQKCIHMVIMNKGVRSFNLIFHQHSRIVVPLPLVVFQSESLVELHLQGCDLRMLRSADNVMLNNLQTLRLQDVHITDEIVEKIISSCPLIENLGLLMCTGLISIKFHKHHNIKDFGCSMNVPLIIEIEYPHALESVRISNCCRSWLFRHKNMHFPHLKSIDLYRVLLPEDMFDSFSSFFPCLNELRLHLCKGLKEFILLSSSIKRLTISMDMRIGIKAFIDTPNILYFEYHGFLPSIKFTTTSNEWESRISVSYKLKPSDNDATSWFLKLNKLLNALSQSHISLNLICSNNEKMHIKDSYGGFYKPVVVENLQLSGCFSSSSDLAVLYCLFRICRPRYIHIDSYDILHAKCNKVNSLAEFICNRIPNEIGCYFWPKDLEEVGIEVSNKMTEEWHCVELTSLPALRFHQRIRFRLTWKEELSKFT